MITTQKINKFVNLDSRFRGNDRERVNDKIVMCGQDESCPQETLNTF